MKYYVISVRYKVKSKNLIDYKMRCTKVTNLYLHQSTMHKEAEFKQHQCDNAHSKQRLVPKQL